MSPADAWTYYGASSARTAGVGTWATSPPEIKALARGLGSERRAEGAITSEQYAQNVLDYVRNNIEVEFRFGLGKGARGALIDQSGTSFDQADLMVALLREGGVSANYKVGTITLSGQEFGLWTGLIKTLNQTTQAVRVDAQAACQFLADGGIPATFSGGATCAALSGDLSSVTLGHVWVLANGKLYDPAYKPMKLTAGTDLAAAMGCGTATAPTCGAQAATSTLSGATSGTLGSTSAPYLQGLNEAAVKSTMTTLAQTLEQSIAASDRHADLEKVLGGGVLDPTYSPTVGVNLPYASTTTQFTFATDLPDLFRTKVTFTCGAAAQTIFGENMSGRRLRLGPTPTGSGVVYLDKTLLSCGTMSGANPPIMTVDHPYVAGSGAYGDESMPLYLAGKPQTMILQLGEASQSTTDYQRRLEVVDPTPFKGQAGASDTCNDPDYGDLPKHCRRDHQASLAADILAQQSGMARLVDGVAGTVTRHHHRMGIVGVQRAPPRDDIKMETDIINIAGAMSVAAKTGGAATRDVGFRANTLVESMVEGSAAQQRNNGWTPLSGVLNFVLSNRKNQKIIYATPANFSAVSAHLTLYAIPDLQAISTEGYDLILPEKGDIGCFNDVVACTGYSGELAIKSGSIAALVRAKYKGAADYDPLSASGGGTPPKAVSAARPKAVVDAASGSFVLEPTDLVTGAGQFPYSLPFKRRYSSADEVREMAENVYDLGATNPRRVLRTYSGPDAMFAGRLGGGWTHNFQVGATIGNDADRAMGQDSAIEASSALAAVYTLVDLSKSPSFEKWVAASFVSHWLSEQMFNNAVNVSVGGQTKSFVKLPSGVFNPAGGGPERLTQSGAPSLVHVGSVVPTLDYQYVTLSYVDGEGATLQFDWAKATGIVGQAAEPVFKATNWHFPAGVDITFNYTLIGSTTNNLSGINPSTVRYLLTGVSNSLGRSLTFANQDTGSQYGVDVGWRVSSVTDETGRQVQYGVSNCPAFYSNNGGGSLINTSQSSSVTAQASLACNTFTVTGPDNAPRVYSYLVGTDSPDPALAVRSAYRLRRWYEPSAPSTPFMTVRYDDLFRVAKVTDALARSTRYLAGSVTGRELLRRAETVDALGASTLVVANDRGSPLRSVDALGRTTTYAYDDADRLVLKTLPEGNAEAKTYDVRSNLLTSTLKSKPLSGLADIVTTTTYGEAAAVFACVDPVNCNHPLTEDGPRVDVTDITNFTWAPTGLLTQILKPADLAGQRPQIDFAYSSVSVGGSTVWLPASRTEKINATTNVVTDYGWNAANKYVLQTETVDSAGLNLINTYTFDALGNLTAIDGPRTDVTDVTNYAWDSSRRLTFEVQPDPDSAGASLRVMTRQTYDVDGQLIELAKGKGASATGSDFVSLEATTMAYDAAGNLVRETTPAGVTQYSYDAVDREKCTTVRMNPAIYSSLPADACVLGATGANGPDRVTRNGYDLAGQLLTVEQGVGTTDARTYATYSYSANGKQTKIVDARANPSEFEYDGFDRLAKLRFPPSTVGATSASTADYETYTYDTANNRLTVRKRDGQIIESCYDALNRNTRRYMRDVANCTTTGLADDVFLEYDLKGQVLSTRFQSATGSGVLATYDKAGRQLTEATFGKSLSFLYDKAGNRTRVLWPVAPSFYVNYLYDAAGRPTQIRQNNLTTALNLLATYAYDDLGRRTSATYGNGTSSSYGYDTAGRVASLGENLAGATHDQTFGFSYTPASQILGRTTSNNLYDWTKPGGGSASKTYTGLNQDAAIVALAGACTDTGAGYDCRGNLRRNGDWVYNYDIENRLISATNSVSGTSMALSYDPIGRLSQTVVGGTTTQYLYDGPRLVATYDGAGAVLQRYIHGTGIDEPIAWYAGLAVTGATWLHHDWQGSVIAESDTTGAAAQLHKYGPWGEAEDWGVGSPFRYTGQIALNDIELYYYKARLYEPSSGRFLQADPAGYGDDLNLYPYVANDPINHVDPTGLFSRALVTEVAEVQVRTQRQVVCCAVLIVRSNTVFGFMYGEIRVPFPIIMDVPVYDAPPISKAKPAKKPPKDAHKPDGAKAPGKPGEAEGFKDPPSGEKWGKPANGGKPGWIDDKGNVWVPTGKGPTAHGGPHWDVQKPGGGYDNVYPGGTVR